MKGVYYEKICTIFILSFAILSFTACSTSTTTNNSNTESTASSTTSVASTTTTASTKTNEPSSETSSTLYGIPNYITDRRVQYDEASKSHTVLWGFDETGNGDYVSAEATIYLKIVNDNGEIVYDKSHQVDKDDYTSFTNIYWDYSRYLGFITINQTDIDKGTVSNGILYMSAETSTGFFSEYEITISDLPLKDFDITIPELPVTINNYGFSGELKYQVDVIDIAITYDEYYDGSVTLDLEVKAKMAYNYNGSSHSDSSQIGYKVKDSEGIVVDSGTFYLDPIAVGDVIKDNSTVFDLRLGEAYTLELIDVD